VLIIRRIKILTNRLTVFLFVLSKSYWLKHNAIFFVLVHLCTALAAQQPAQYALAHLNPLLWNPAYAGMDNTLHASLGYRKQWTQLQGSPESQYISLHLPLYLVGGGLGLSLENDVLGAGRWASAQVNYSYHLPVGAGILSLGLGAGMVQRTLDGGQLRTPEGTYEPGAGINHNDPLLPFAIESGVSPAFHAGLFYRSNHFEFGLGLRNAIAPEIILPSLTQSLDRIFSFHLGGNISLGENLLFQPRLVVQSDGRQTQTNLVSVLEIQQRFLAGVSLRGYSNNTGDALIILAGIPLSDYLSIVYAYDITLSDLRLASNGSHEIMVRYNLQKPMGKGKLPRIIYNPRTL
jgi:type IX secretion system PorP/SprF family membrane protein